MRNGEHVEASILYDMNAKFAKLKVGKNVVTAKNRNQLFPLIIAMGDLHPLTKVWVNYKGQPKNKFVIKVNDEDIYTLAKEGVDYDPSKTEVLDVSLNLNDKKDKSGYQGLEWAISGSIPWIVNDVGDKV